MSLTIHTPNPVSTDSLLHSSYPTSPQLDLLHAGVHGNKARKLLTLAEQGLSSALPPVVASHGGVQVSGPIMNDQPRNRPPVPSFPCPCLCLNTPSLPPILPNQNPTNIKQSNVLAALAGLLGPTGGRFPRARLLYFCKPLPGWLKKQPVGIYERALALGVEVTVGIYV